MPELTLIVATTRGGAIGHKGGLIHHISADLRNFKDVTMGHPLIMGRRTFESFPNGPLPGRRNMVVSRNPSYRPTPPAEAYQSLDEALSALGSQDEAMVIGGGDIYRQTIGMASRMYITEIDAPAPPDADTFFPPVDMSEWKAESTGEWQTDPKSNVNFRFICLSRI
ncbi:MAG TPA: dihydrofolate reductase [Muribaculaceae bacterium]|jgi:dihydrofolate reductase|nr:dihydrofolate reductase [Muribaculaceae bacterium]